MKPYPEHAHSALGVEGRMFARYERSAAKGTFSAQTWKASRARGCRKLVVELRFDDECSNGHNTFSATATLYENQQWVAGGCLHEEIVKWFPELAPLLKWHLTSTDGPMHYVANTVYLAGDRDHNGLREGETRQLRNGKTGELCWKRTECTLPQHVDADAKPDESQVIGYEPWVRVGEGKARELDSARIAAVWPDATEDDLTAPGLAARLEARLPRLLLDFRAAIESVGFAWSTN